MHNDHYIHVKKLLGALPAGTAINIPVMIAGQRIYEILVFAN